MILAFFTNKALLGSIPEPIGLMLFGVTLVAVTIGLRWFFDMREEESLEKLVECADR
jgi:hypothetical protein